MGLLISKRERELRRETRIRQARARVQSFLQQSRGIERQYWVLGRTALGLGDRERFRQLAVAMIRTHEGRNRWERYLLELDALNVRREETSAAAALLQSLDAVAASMLDNASAVQAAALQEKLSDAMSRAAALSDSLAVAMDVGTQPLFSSDGLDAHTLEQVLRGTAAAAAAAEGGCGEPFLDPGGDALEGALNRIEATMRDEMVRAKA
jgi:hypothetical protein